MKVLAVPASLPTARGAFWCALALAFGVLVLPDCCLNGRHAFGAGMELLGPVCRAAS